MEISLQDLLSCAFFSSAKVLAGERGLSNMVTSVTVLDSPDAPRYMKGGELVITTAYSLLNDESGQKEVIKNLARSRVTGLGMKLRFFNNQLPKIMKITADELNFPLISIPDEYAYTDIYEFITSNLISRTTKEVKREDEVYKEINESIYEEGLMGVAKSLYKWTGLGVVIIFNEQFLAYPCDMIPEDFPVTTPKWRKRFNNNKLSLNVDSFYYERNGKVFEWLAADIIEKGKTQGKILLLKGGREYVKEDYILLDCAASACAMELKRINSIIHVQRKYRKTFLECFLNGQYTWEEAVFQAGELDFELPEEGIVVYINFNPKVVNVFDNKHVEVIDSAVTNILGKSMVFGPLDNSNIALFIPNDQQKYLPLIEKLYWQLMRDLRCPDIIVGIGRPATFSDVKKSFEEAKNAIKIGSCLDLKPKIYLFSRLGFYRLLKLPDVSQEMERYYEDYLKPLEQKDNSSELIDTLICFIESGYNYRETAQKMYLHPNTVRYRILVIEKICRVNLKYSYDRLNIEIALKILPLINSENR